MKHKRKKNNSRLALLAAGGLGLALALRTVSRKISRVDFRGKVVVITGGSRGLGLALARQLVAEEARIALIARDPNDLARAEAELVAMDAEVMSVAADVTNREAVIHALGRVLRRYGQIDMLINNAGVIQVGPLEHMEVKDFEDAMNVHFWGPLFAALEVIPHMRSRGNGRIVNITSIGGRVAVPHLAPYTASKFALVGLSNAMRAELAKDGIAVTTVIPGLMRTGSYVNAFFKGKHKQEYTWFSVLDSLPVTSTSVQTAARQIIDAARVGQSQLTITPQAQLLLLANSLFPGFVTAATKLTNRLLPGAAGRRGDQIRRGWESQSRWSPSGLTVLGDRAIPENNQA